MMPFEPVKIFRADLTARFMHRLHRFAVRVSLDDGRIIDVHAPNPGRLLELYLPRRRVILEDSLAPARKLRYTLAALEHRGAWVPMVSASANRVAEAAASGLFPGYPGIRSELSLGRRPGEGGRAHRIDLELRREDGLAPERILCEVKACSLVEEGIAMFPDAPSERAASHIEALLEQAGQPDTRSALVFVISHGSPELFIPNYHNDPRFALALDAGLKAGLEIRLLSTRTSPDGLVRFDPLPGGREARVCTRGISEIIEADSGWLLIAAQDESGRAVVEASYLPNGLSRQLRSLGARPGIVSRLGPRTPLTKGLRNIKGSDAERTPLRLQRQVLLPLRCRKAFDLPGELGRLMPHEIQIQESGTYLMKAHEPGPHPLEDERFTNWFFPLRHRISAAELG